MNNLNSSKHDGTITTKVVCAICFLLFSFLWLYWLQADSLAIAQHVMSQGVTHYDKGIGTIIFLIVLMLIQFVVAHVAKPPRRTYALSYFPSLLLLAFLSDLKVDENYEVSVSTWYWLFPLLLFIWGVCIWLARQVLPFANNQRQYVGVLSMRTWLNLLQLLAMMLIVALLSNTNAVYLNSAHAEVSLVTNDYDEAALVGGESLETNERLTMLRAFALSKKGVIADELFSYPVRGTAQTLLPMTVKPFMLSEDSIWKHLGARPHSQMPLEYFYEILERDSLATPAVADYRLCGYLMDRNLNKFVTMLPTYYEVADSLPLPRHYKEALILYKHQTKDSKIAYTDSLMEEQWNILQQLKSDYKVNTERRYKIFKSFQHTYWYYYLYE